MGQESRERVVGEGMQRGGLELGERPCLLKTVLVRGTKALNMHKTAKG